MKAESLLKQPVRKSRVGMGPDTKTNFLQFFKTSNRFGTFGVAVKGLGHNNLENPTTLFIVFLV